MRVFVVFDTETDKTLGSLSMSVSKTHEDDFLSLLRKKADGETLFDLVGTPIEFSEADGEGIWRYENDEVSVIIGEYMGELETYSMPHIGPDTMEKIDKFNQANKKYQELVQEEKSNSSRFGLARITDYEATESASSFVQDLEVSIVLELPDGSKKTYQTLHDSSNEDPIFSWIEQRAEITSKNVTELSKLFSTELPVVYYPSKDEWFFHITTSTIKLSYRLARRGIGTVDESNVHSIGKNYGQHATVEKVEKL